MPEHKRGNKDSGQVVAKHCWLQGLERKGFGPPPLHAAPVTGIRVEMGTDVAGPVLSPQSYWHSKEDAPDR
jgi:hypothetical protein